MAVFTHSVPALQSIPSPAALERRVLVAGDAGHHSEVLERAGYSVATVSTGAEGATLLERRRHDAILFCQTGDSESDWDTMRRLTAAAPGTPVIAAGASESPAAAVEAMREGAYDYLPLNAGADEMTETVRRAAMRTRRDVRRRELRAELNRAVGFERLIGQSPALLAALDTASRAAQSEATVLLRGEAGSGKATLAEAMHQNSGRRSARFVVCQTRREDVEALLFGPGGLLWEADGGTLYFEEVHHLPASVQARLMRLLERGEAVNGSGAAKAVDVRVMAGASQDLRAAVDEGKFRADLYYRLACVQIELPPLRERLEDLALLVSNFLEASAKTHHKLRGEATDALLHELRTYSWPGNVEELRSVIDSLVSLSKDGQPSESDLPNFLRRDRPVLEVIHLDLPPHGISLEAVEKELLFRALQKFNWNQTHAARYLSLSRKTMIYRMEKYGLHKRDLAEAAELS